MSSTQAVVPDNSRPHLNPHGQILSHSLSSCFFFLNHTMNPSHSNPGVSTSTQDDPKAFNFTSPAVSRSSPKAGLSKPRMVKLRRQLDSQNFKSAQDIRAASGFNPFGPGSASPDPGGDFVFGASQSNLGKGVVEGMKSLNLNSDAGSFVFGSDENRSCSSSSVIDENMRKLKIGDKEEKEGQKIDVEGRTKLNCGNVGTGVESTLPDELKKKLNIEACGHFDDIIGDDSVTKFGFKSGEKDSSRFGGPFENVLPDQIKNLSIKDSANTVNAVEGTAGESISSYVGGPSQSVLQTEIGHKLKMGSVLEKSYGQTDREFSSSQIFTKDVETGNMDGFKGGMQDVSGNQFQRGQPKIDGESSGIAGPSSAFSSSGLPGMNAFQVPPAGQPNNSEGFNITGTKDSMGLPFFEFTTPNTKGSLFSGSLPKMEFGAKVKDPKLKKKKGKLKQPTTVHLWPGQEFVPRESSSQEIPEVSESYSPMDVSPYQETLSDAQLSRETSVASEESFSLDNQYATTDSHPKVLNDTIDEDLVTATQQMDINGEDVNCTETKDEGTEYSFGKSVGAGNPPEESISGAETESFKSANEEIEFINDVFASSENEVSSRSCDGRQDSDVRTQYFTPACSENIDISGFSFAASSSSQSSPKRHPKKKNWAKVGHENSFPNAKGQYSLSSLHFSPFSGSSLPVSPSRSKKVGPSAPSCVVGDNSEVLRGQQIKQEPDLIFAASAAAQEACEKWRLRGNQAYTSGDLSKAEDCYTQGLNCLSKGETSRSCLRALMLCYSNRAATRMSLRRMRDALGDCKMAAAIDPNFVKVQVRAANCYLALGEVEDASQYFMKCLQLGSDVCVDRKIAVEASEGLQKAQKVSECMQHASKLLQNRRCGDGESALEMIAEALIISPFSEKLLEMKAEFLFMLRRCEEVIVMCEQTFDSARKNSPPLHFDYQLPSVDGPELAKDTSFGIWRYRLIFNSYFYLGKLDEAMGSLEKLEELLSVTKSATKNSSMTLESLIPLAASVRELLRHKTAGNEAFQAGRHSEAIEHYTAALSHSVESRPFAAICFCNRAAAYKALGQITDAIADCSLAIALDGNYLKAISRRATLYEMIRDYGQAANDLQRLIAIYMKQAEEKTNQFGPSDRPTNFANDLRQARLRLSTVSELARKQIPLDMYLILGVEASASASEIKKAYRKAALRHHPDKAGQSLARSDNGDDGLWRELGEEVHKDADRLFKMIGEAYAVLSDPTKRSEYDLEEELRNTQKKHNGTGTYRAYTQGQNYSYERSGSRKQWTDAWRPYGR